MSREREDSIIYVHPKTHEFLRAAIEDGAVVRTLENAEESQLERVIRKVNIMGVYLASPATCKNIAMIYPGFDSKQRAWQIVREGMAALWSSCSQEIQERFPLDEIKVRKPPGRRSWKRNSRARGGLAWHVAELLEEEVAFEEIKIKLDLSGRKVIYLRAALKKRGFKIPYVITPLAENKELVKRLQRVSNDSEIQEALDRVKISFYHRNKKSSLVSVSEVARSLGLRFRPQQITLFVESLAEANIPVGHIQKTVKSGPQKGKQNYYFIVSRHLERAQKVLSGFLL